MRITYKCWVRVVDSSFYVDVQAQVLDKRVNNGKPEYLVSLDPPRWLPESKLELRNFNEGN
jgi:hypothetical protein